MYFYQCQKMPKNSENLNLCYDNVSGMVRQWFDIGCAWAKARYDEQHPSRGIVSGEELRRLFVVHMNFRLALRFPHRKP